jgi:hypothetical protein
MDLLTAAERVRVAWLQHDAPPEERTHEQRIAIHSELFDHWLHVRNEAELVPCGGEWPQEVAERIAALWVRNKRIARDYGESDVTEAIRTWVLETLGGEV